MLTVRLDSIDSTHLYINSVRESEVLVTANYQTAGQGMGTNTWESAPDCNLLFSIRKLVGWMPVSQRFYLSMAGALALKNVLDSYCDGITLKWPNDIYWRDRKISGTLMVTSIAGKNLRDCVFSVGLNVNQREFLSDAPNPVSLFQILGTETDRELLLQQIIASFDRMLLMLKDGAFAEIRTEYLSSLYRRQGYWQFEDNSGRFEARIVGVSECGYLQLEKRGGTIHEYEVKQLKYII